MKMTFLKCAAVTVCVGYSQFVSAQPYMAVDVGVTAIKQSGVSSGAGVSAGYGFSPNLAAEMSYRSLGNFGGSITSLQASVLGKYPMTDAFTLYGRLGAAHTKKPSIHLAYARTGVKSSSLDLMVGAGIEYAMTQNVSVRAELVRIHGIARQVNTGITYKF